MPILALHAAAPSFARGTEELSVPVTVIERQRLENLPVRINVLDVPGKPASLRGFTDARGNLSYTTVPPERWAPTDVIEGMGVQLPHDGLVTLYGRSPADGLVNIIRRQSYGLRNGRVVPTEDWIRDKLSPFSLLCRADEGLPGRLQTGERLAFRVPGGKDDLGQVLKMPFLYEPRSIRLPDGLGYNVSSAAGPDPGRTWRSLEQLVGRGLIADLEWDPCWKFLPESSQGGGCAPTDKAFPDKAVRYSGLNLSGSLKASYTDKALSGAWLMFEPLTPTPFFNPGERPGDDQPPRIHRTGTDGAFRAPLDGLDGALQVGVAQGCAEHSTVVVVNDPQGKVSRQALGISTGAPVAGGAESITSPPLPAAGTAATAETPPPPRSTPRKPKEGEMVCGPDVTDYVLQVLKLIEDHYNQWDPATRTRQCRVLYKPAHFQAAWDMQYFAPSDGEDFMPHIFFQRAAPDYCAVPRWPCGTTVKFLGYCLNAQVVNYVQWGLMNQLCDSQVLGIASHMLRSGFTIDYTGQEAMAALGQAFGAFGTMDLDFRKRSMKRYLDEVVRDNQNAWYAMPGTQCAMTCDEMASGAKAWLDNADWGYQWGPGGMGESIRTLRQERQKEESRQQEERKRQGGKRP